MADLSTSYLGLDLKNPLVPSSSPLSKHLDSARRLEDAGAGALVMHSLFEEKIEEEDERLARFFHQQSIGHGEAESFHPIPDGYKSYEERYLEHLESLKGSLEIPVIASLNGTTDGGWVNYASELEKAGADALELNVYYIPAAPKEDCCQVEQRYVDVLTAVREKVTIPVAMKLSPQFSSLVNFATRLEEAGANGLVLFNRFYQPDFDLETLEVVPNLVLSSSKELRLPLRWIAILYGRVNADFALTSGVHKPTDIVKAMMAGAKATMLASVLLKKGPQKAAKMLSKLGSWLEENEYESIKQMQGSMSQQAIADPSAFERANYMKVLDSFK